MTPPHLLNRNTTNLLTLLSSARKGSGVV